MPKEQKIQEADGRPIQFHTKKALLRQNNGWIKVESEKDFPTRDNCDYWIVKHGKVELFHWPKRETLNSVAWLSIITHYQLIDKPQPPIY